MKNSTKLLIGVAAIAVAVGITIACTETNNQASENGEKYLPCEHTSCYFWNDPPNMPDCKECLNYHLCYISYGCIDSLDIGIDPDPGTGPGKGTKQDGTSYYIIIPQYGMSSERLMRAFDNFFDDGEITFTEDCPADTPKLFDLLPDGWLPAGTYPISKHGDDAWIDITSAVAI